QLTEGIFHLFPELFVLKSLLQLSRRKLCCRGWFGAVEILCRWESDRWDRLWRGRGSKPEELSDGSGSVCEEGCVCAAALCFLFSPCRIRLSCKGFSLRAFHRRFLLRIPASELEP